MTRVGRPGLADAHKQEAWQQWKQGQALSEIGRSLGRSPASIYGILIANGGIVPPMRCRSARTLTLGEREEISRGLAAELSLREIARSLGRSASTISREVQRNGGREHYRASQADELTWERAKRPKACLLALNPILRRIVAEKLAQRWSPEQISSWLKLRFPTEESLWVSHETIYRSLFIQARGVLKKELRDHLRTRRRMRRSKSATAMPRGGIVDAVSIRERPPEAEDRAVPGHWEGDLVSGSKNSHVATLVERNSRFVMLVKVKGKDTASVVSALSRQVRTLPMALRKSLTWDRGTEMASHKDFTVATNVKVYFCDPQSPWQRGSNENTNGLLRQYLPHGTDLSVHSQAALNRIALSLNQRPRETLGFRTPAERLSAYVASIS
jgi:IS30 family transposase